ncbi:hypothetical protein MSAN_00597700 [Mycena sanguinolenta]|uniref:Uncharacterized protein n=1 Tax=Mycena sanguinolenta TaxID=230812 RepID=A0A8H7DHZ0_9AGAR|nr:hypothetical protein MSAN_00597700 [Mycena sanguinolenta]
MPLLRGLDVFITARQENNIIFQGLPVLSTVVLRRPTVEILPWKQLTNLTLLRANFTNCAAILLQTTGLIHCELTEVWFDITYTPSDIVLRRLQSLAFHNIRVAADVDGCLNCFILPALRRLKIQEKGLGSASVLGLESFISKSGCSLQEVCISQAKTKNEASYLEAFPSIPKLSFSDSYDGMSDDED